MFFKGAKALGFVLLVAAYLWIAPSAAQEPAGGPPRFTEANTAKSDLSKHECLLEWPFVALYKAAIADPQAQADFSQPGLEASSFTTEDGHIIRGLVWRAEKAKGYLLIALGTSMLAEEVYPAFADLRGLDLDVFIYNYRGFKNSEGDTTLRGILSDIVTVTDSLNADPQYRYGFLYGLSFGGIAFSSAIGGRSSAYDGVILDSVPDTVPFPLFCPDTFDPRENLPPDCSNWRVIAGGRDSVIGDSGLRLAEAVKACGGSALTRKTFGHVFMDGADNTHQRLAALKTYLQDRMADSEGGD